jgi:cyclophilin family peptidyl-prolyl cis-trans isomerase/protein-disulfide isomerase
MQKTLVLVLLVALLVSSCGVQETPPAGPPPTSRPTEVTSASEDFAASCNAIQSKPTPGPEEPSRFPRVSESDHSLGPPDAAVTLIVYSDFQCIPCAEVAGLLKRLQARHPDELRVIYRYFPLMTINDKAALAVQGAEAAGLQGKFWEMHDALFQNLDSWSSLKPDDFEAWLAGKAAELGLDRPQFETDVQSSGLAEMPVKAFNEGLGIGMASAPFILVNGQIYSGPVNFNALNNVIGAIALGERQFTRCPDVVIDPDKQYIATLHTSKGEIVIQLFADKVPLAVNNFVFLARSGWYDGNPFYRVITGFTAQTGDPSGTGMGLPGYLFNTELDPGLRFDRPGMVAMDNIGPNTNGSRFFITLAELPQMDGSFTIFGQVLQGMDVLEALTPRFPEGGGDLPEPDLILSVEIEEK